MNLLPPAGPDRTRLIVLVAVLGVLGATWYYQSGTSAPLPLPTTAGTLGATTPSRDAGTTAKPVSRQAAAKPTTPQALKLAELERVPDEPETGRNPFRFGVKVAPPQPAAPQPVYTLPPVVTPPPPPPPDVKLKLSTVIDGPDGKKRAYLVDPSGAMFEGTDGQIIDGRYRLVKVERTSAVVEFRDGTARKTIFLGR